MIEDRKARPTLTRALRCAVGFGLALAFQGCTPPNNADILNDLRVAVQMDTFGPGRCATTSGGAALEAGGGLLLLCRLEQQASLAYKTPDGRRCVVTSKEVARHIHHCHVAGLFGGQQREAIRRYDTVLECQ